MKNLLLASTSTVHGSGFLEYLNDELVQHFKDTNEILFIPFARPGGISHDSYTDKVRAMFSSIGKHVKGLHELEDKALAIKMAKGIFTGGGNTFVLLNELYKNNLIDILKKSLISGTPYLGTSAGTNICGQTIGTTNDMPIIYPPSFNALAMVPFNINPHYLDPDPNSKHMGETRETRISEFHKFSELPVIGLREGSYLKVDGNAITLEGNLSARLFKSNEEAKEIPPSTKLNF